MSKMYGKGKTPIESEENAKLRLQIELEFVQCLGNPNYLNFLAQRGYFKDQTFINYLKYLLYWKEPEYAKYIMYPICLYFLDLLQYEHFRREIANTQCCKFIDDQAILLWQHYSRHRTKALTQGDYSALDLNQDAQNNNTNQNGNNSINNNTNNNTSNSINGINSANVSVAPPAPLQNGIAPKTV